MRCEGYKNSKNQGQCENEADCIVENLKQKIENLPLCFDCFKKARVAHTNTKVVELL